MSTVSPSVPSYRRHKPTGQAVVTLGGREFYLGRYGTAASRKEYNRRIAEWLASDGTANQANDLTVIELVNHFWRFAKRHYVKNGRPTSEQSTIRSALRFLKDLYAERPAAQFGPLALKTVRQKMIDAGWCRNTINASVGKIRRMFRWAVSEELLPVTVYQALTSVQGLQAGRTEAVETEPVKPVPDAVVEATLPFLSTVVADMVQFQRVTGCRPQDVCQLRPCDLDTRDDVWGYRPSSHKTQHRGRERIVFVGPKGQNLLTPYLLREKSAHCFAPTDSERKRRAKLHESRVTPLGYGNRPGTNCKGSPKRKAGEHYTTASYRRAISRAVQSANAKRQEDAHDGESPELLPNWARTNCDTRPRPSCVVATGWKLPGQ